MFQIFYPDLLNPSKTPEFSVLPCEDNEDFAILRFKAGPPYEVNNTVLYVMYNMKNIELKLFLGHWF